MQSHIGHSFCVGGFALNVTWINAVLGFPRKNGVLPEDLAWDAKLFEYRFHFCFPEKAGIAVKLPTVLHD